MTKLRTCFETFGWNDYSCANLAGVSGGQLKEMLRSVMCRCVENDSAVDLDSKPKLCVLSSVCANCFDGRCWKVREKSHRRVLMMLRDGTAPSRLKLADGRAYSEKRECVESVMRMKKWKTATIGCYDVLGGNQKDNIF